MTLFSTRSWLAAMGGAAVLVGAAAYVGFRLGGGSPDGQDKGTPPTEADNQEPDPPLQRAPGFQEAAAASGLSFHMRFLPGEQGENFKINLYDHGAGIAIGDYDGDGHDDIYFVNQLGPNALFKNNGDGTFVEVTARAGVALGDRICVAATFADFDNDGHQDLYVTSTRGGNVLFRNQGNGTFKDVTTAAGLTHVGHSQCAVFFDYDNDGFLDLFVTNTAQWTTTPFNELGRYFPGKSNLKDLLTSPKEWNLLYHNNGDGTFTDVTEKAGLKGKGWGGDAAVFDYNGDGYLDLAVTNMVGPVLLYRNNGNGTFTDVAAEVLGRTSFGSMGARVFDFNNDGKLDLFIVDMHSDMWMRPDFNSALIREKKKYPYFLGPMPLEDPAMKEEEKKFADTINLPYDRVVFGNTLFRNRGDGRFDEVSDQAGVETFWPWGMAAGDFDNDGFEDLYIPTGMGYPWFYWPNSLLMNNGDGTFKNRTRREGCEPVDPYFKEPQVSTPCPRSSRCAATADFDGDGQLEIVTNNFNDRPYYFRNQFPRKNYIAFRLTGTKSNRDAIGALVRLHAGKKVMIRQVNSATGYQTQSSKTVHFGLGDLAQVDRIEIDWPSRIRQTVARPEINKLHKVTEPVR